MNNKDYLAQFRGKVEYQDVFESPAQQVQFVKYWMIVENMRQEE